MTKQSTRADTSVASQELVDPLRLRRALGMYATGVTIITASHAQAGPVGLTANSFSSVSLDPPLVLFSLANTARSLSLLLESPGFCVNVLRKDQELLARRFAVQGRDKWADVAYQSGSFGAPVLPDTMAAFDCLHYAQYDGGDHQIIVGRVVAMEHAVQGEPLLFFGGHYRTLSTQTG